MFLFCFVFLYTNRMQLESQRSSREIFTGANNDRVKIGVKENVSNETLRRDIHT